MYAFKTSRIGSKVYSFFSKKWYFDLIYNKYIVHKILGFGYNVTFKIIDRGLIELVGPLGLVRVIKSLTTKAAQLHSGFIYHYTFVMICSIVLLLIILSLGGFELFVNFSILGLVLLFCFLSDILVGDLE